MNWKFLKNCFKKKEESNKFIKIVTDSVTIRYNNIDAVKISKYGSVLELSITLENGNTAVCICSERQQIIISSEVIYKGIQSIR